MNGKGFLKEINNLDDDLIMEAAEAERTGRTGRNIIKFAGMAACVAIFTGVITASVLIEKQKMEKEDAGEAAVEYSYEMGRNGTICWREQMAVSRWELLLAVRQFRLKTVISREMESRTGLRSTYRRIWWEML